MTKIDNLAKSRKCSFSVIPVKTGIQYFRAFAEFLDSGYLTSQVSLRKPTSKTWNSFFRALLVMLKT